MAAEQNPFLCTYCDRDVTDGKEGQEYPYTVHDAVWAQLHGGKYVDDNLCITCANAKSVQHRGKVLSYEDFNPLAYGDEPEIDLSGRWVRYLHPEYRAALLRGYVPEKIARRKRAERRSLKRDRGDFDTGGRTMRQYSHKNKSQPKRSQSKSMIKKRSQSRRVRSKVRRNRSKRRICKS